MVEIKVKSGIYKIICLSNNKVYIGSTKNFDLRMDTHFKLLRRGAHFNTHLQRAFNKYGEENFIFEIIELVPRLVNESIEDFKHRLINIREQFWLDHFESYKRKNGYNILKFAGSSFGYKHSSKYKKMLSKIRIGKNNPFYGKSHTNEHKQKISELNKGENNRFYGKTHTEETRKILSEKLTGRIITDEWKDNISKSLSGLKKTKNHIDKVALAKSKPIIQKDLDGNIIKFWRSAKEAAEYFNINKSGINDCCRNGRKTCFNYKWEYI